MVQKIPDSGGRGAPIPSAPTEDLPEGFLAPGQVLGERYQIRSQLGRGGMGEVWRIFDLVEADGSELVHNWINDKSE